LCLAGVANASHYIQGSSSETQCPGKKPTAVTIDMNDANDGITLESPGTFTIAKDGVYLIIAAPQVGRPEAGPAACLDLWLAVNGKDVTNSNVQMCVDEGSNAKDVIVCQGIAPMKEGDVVEVMMSSNPKGLCIEAIQPENEPLVPSIIFSAMEQS